MPIEQQKQVSVELIAGGDLLPSEMKAAYGWGANAKQMMVEGTIKHIVLSKDGKWEFGIRILEDGSLILTSYNAGYTQVAERNMRLTNEIPWKAKKGRKK